MQSQEDVKQVIDKITEAQAKGGRCMGFASGKSVSQWTDIFNDVSAHTGLPILQVDPLDTNVDDILSNEMTKFTDAFNATNGEAAIVLVDASKNNDPQTNMGVLPAEDSHMIASHVEALTKQFPKAIHIQIAPDIKFGNQDIVLHCLQPN